MTRAPRERPHLDLRALVVELLRRVDLPARDAQPTDTELGNVSRRTCDRVRALLVAHGVADADGLCPPETPAPMEPLHDAARVVRSRFARVDDDGNV